MQHLIEFLIPAYKRFDGVATAALSVAKQIAANCYENVVRVTVVDDSSSGFEKDSLVNLLGSMASLVSIESNEFNKGMSQNIFDMVSDSKAKFCTVLTDDDWLVDDKLPELVEYLQSIVNNEKIGGLFTPRYSYIETGELHCVACKPFSQDRLIENGPIQAMKHCHNGFILTGFIFRPQYFARHEWYNNIENSYFPVINFGMILSRYSLLFVDRNWFHHTVLNVCHWESWGEDEVSQGVRLHQDYMDAVGILASSFMSVDIPLATKISVIWFESVNYLRELSSNGIRTISSRINAVSQRTRQRFAFKFSVVIYPIYIFFYYLRFLKRVFYVKKY